jgi:hypothetical protein
VAIASQVAVLARATVATTAHRERSQVVGGSWGAGGAPASEEAPRASRAPTAQQHGSTATASANQVLHRPPLSGRGATELMLWRVGGRWQ